MDEASNNVTHMSYEVEIFIEVAIAFDETVYKRTVQDVNVNTSKGIAYRYLHQHAALLRMSKNSPK